MCSSFAF
jgi:predicted RNase H-like nuclease (RuvC/YqgF family)